MPLSAVTRLDVDKRRQVRPRTCRKLHYNYMVRTVYGCCSAVSESMPALGLARVRGNHHGHLGLAWWWCMDGDGCG